MLSFVLLFEVWMFDWLWLSFSIEMKNKKIHSTTIYNKRTKREKNYSERERGIEKKTTSVTSSTTLAFDIDIRKARDNNIFFSIVLVVDWRVFLFSFFFFYPSPSATPSSFSSSPCRVTHINSMRSIKTHRQMAVFPTTDSLVGREGSERLLVCPFSVFFYLFFSSPSSSLHLKAAAATEEEEEEKKREVKASYLSVHVAWRSKHIRRRGKRGEKTTDASNFQKEEKEENQIRAYAHTNIVYLDSLARSFACSNVAMKLMLLLRKDDIKTASKRPSK